MWRKISDKVRDGECVLVCIRRQGAKYGVLLDYTELPLLIESVGLSEMTDGLWIGRGARVRL